MKEGEVGVGSKDVEQGSRMEGVEGMEWGERRRKDRIDKPQRA